MRRFLLFCFLLFCFLLFAFSVSVSAGIRVFVSVLQALPLCGAALTFFAAAKKVREGLNNPFSAWDL
ncbi:hypothetical protein V4C56_36380 [Paraburkholderia azotifigens]